MSLEVEFITLGDAATRIDTPAPTLRLWTDQLETYEVHFTLRNNRNERIYYQEDLDIFKFIRDWKEEYGRRTTTKDLAYMLAERAREGKFKLRTREDAPMPSNPSNKTQDLLNQEDIQRLMQSDRVKQFIEIIISETQKSFKGEVIEEFSAELYKKTNETLEEMRAIEQRSIKREEEEKSRLEEMREILNRIEESTSPKEEEQEVAVATAPEKTGFFKRFFK